MTKIKLSEAVNLQQELFNLLKENISFLVKMDIRNLIDSFKPEIENYQTTLRELYKKYGEERKGRFEIKKENIEIANKELKLISEKEIEIKGKLKKDNLKDLTSETEYFFVFDLIE